MASQSPPSQAMFIARSRCIACDAADVVLLDSGTYADEPLRGYLAQDPWGVSPLDALGDHPWEFLRCRSCGQMFHRWLLSPEWQEIKFTQWMSKDAIFEFERLRGYHTQENDFASAVTNVKHVLRIEALTRAIRGADAVRLLDFGCGWGQFLGVAKQFGFHAHGVDRAPDRQEGTQQRGIEVFADLDTAQEVVGKKFHAATLFQVLEHIDEPRDLLLALHDAIAPGGVLVVEVPNCEGVVGIRSRSDYYNIHPLEHFNCFTPASLRGIVERAGFRHIPTPVAHVTARPAKVWKVEIGRWLRALRPAGTNQYFLRV